MMKAQEMENTQAQYSAPNPETQKKNFFYSIFSRGDEEDSPDVITLMLQMYSIYVYDLLDPIPLYFCNSLCLNEVLCVTQRYK